MPSTVVHVDGSATSPSSIDFVDGRVPRRMNLRDTAGGYLRETIFAGELKPGTRIDQDSVADHLGMSKLPVREAILLLEQEGLVENIPRRGAFVAMLEPDDVYDHYLIFARVAAMAAERAASRITSEECEVLASLVAQMKRWTKADRNYDNERLNYRFHRIINRAGGSRRLKIVLKSLARGMPEDLYHRTRGWTSSAQLEHEALLQALIAGDSARAAHAAFEHIRAGSDLVVESLTANGFWT